MTGSKPDLQVTKTIIKSRTSSTLGQIGLFTSELLIMGKIVVPRIAPSVLSDLR